MSKQQFVDAGGNLVDVSAANPLPSTGGGGGGVSTVDRELVVITYFAKINFTGATAGDTITLTQIIDVTATPTTVSSIWRNQSTATDLAGAPTIGTQIELVGQSALTDGQLRATAVPVNGTVTANLSATDNAVLDQIELNTDTAGLRLSFNNIANAPANTVGTWNTYFGTAIFETLEVVGNDAILKGVGTFVLPTDCFKNSTALTKIVDMSGYIVAAYDNVFQNTTVLNYLYLPALISSGFSLCSGSTVVSAFIPKAKQFGDDSFNGCTALTLIDFSELEDVDDSFLKTSSAIQTVLLPSLKIAGDNLLQSTSAYIVSVPELVVTKNSAFDRTGSGNVEIELKAPKWKYTGTDALKSLKNFSELVIPSLEIAGTGSFSVTSGANNIKATVNTKFAGSNAAYIAFKAANTVTQTTVDALEYGQQTSANSKSIVPASDAIFAFKPTANNRSAFADQVTVPRLPINQHGFTHGLYADNVLFGQSGAGALTTTSNGRLSITSGTASGGFAWFSSERPIIYRQGQGVCDRFTCFFGTPTANILQFKGVASYAAATPQTPIDAVGFCYYVGTALTNGIPVAYTGTTFGILHRNFASGSTVNTFYPQTEWNVDKLDGTGLSGLTWDKTKGDLVEVLYGHQGYSGFVFLWYLPDQHEYVVCHQIPYANANTEMHLSNPNVMHYELMINSAIVTATTMRGGSIASFLDGERVVTNRPQSFDNGSPTANINGYSSICAIQMATTFNGAPVRGIVRILGISVACHSGNGIIRTLIGATVTGQTTFTAIEPLTATVTGSSGNYTIATSGGANTFASCPVLGNTTVGAVTAVPRVQGKGITLHTAANEYIDLKDDNVYITAGQVFTVAVNTAANATFTASIHFVVEI